MGAFEDLHRNRVTGSLAMFDRMIFKGRLTALCKNNGARCLAGVVGDDDAVPLAEHDGVHSVPQVELGYDAADVALHGCFRYDQPLRGLVVRVSTGDEPEHFALAVGLAVRATGPAPRAYLAPSSTRFAGTSTKAPVGARGVRVRRTGRVTFARRRRPSRCGRLLGPG
jgi:hypothetical protein